MTRLPSLYCWLKGASGDRGADPRGDVPHRGTYPLAVARHILLGQQLDLDYGRWRLPEAVEESRQPAESPPQSR